MELSIIFDNVRLNANKATPVDVRQVLVAGRLSFQQLAGLQQEEGVPAGLC